MVNSAFAFGQDEMEKATIDLNFVADSLHKSIGATVTDQTGNPVSELELYFYVQRTFSLLPIGGDFNMTDEDGYLEIEFPTDLPGDEKGNLEIVVKLTESENYSDQTIKISKDWGIPYKMNAAENKRSLWAASANAPIPLILIVNSMLVFVYIIIFYILFELYKISTIKKLKN